ncbi:hypothetical protein CpB0087 [Chlamydia pneumoniae TW-183]|uniref:Uncharacterized protein CPn_0087/CP_0687/CPj0087/CpB0087 n=1 Tax=Chlamydia pneumoniae TaxID=83558 RepID=A0A0F7WPK3_CHLPN|nr:DUF2764 family protein [Chlamydia pneumoniae]AAP98020.1 hypothetical protein CpB0087 [Chlamydia pneumoniae TW-183]CRI42215.1 Uncharacterized protein CPn_0087/CP_0687/CPj0087/CpB0087 [Chlamydia pneumoniae]CRI51237.1 Uncharacterized protein CPn_0087/CP_0687/CPj0087/CpB0087 [Chlamydia pneumoniae]
MTQYYFLSSFLPTQLPESVPLFSISDLDDLLYLNLSENDLCNYGLLKRFFDFENFAFFWAGKPIPFSFGEVTQENIERMLSSQQWSDDNDFEDFFKDFLMNHKSSQDRLNHFSDLFREFLSYHQTNSSKFLQDYFRFQQQLRVVLAGFRARVLNMDVSYVLRDEDSSDPVVLEVLMQKDSPNYELPEEFSDLQGVLDDYGLLPHTLNRALALYQFHKLEGFCSDSYFDGNVILARCATYMFAIRNSLASVEKGREIINHIEKAIKW